MGFRARLTIALVLGVLLTACGETPPTQFAAPTQTSELQQTATRFSPTATPVAPTLTPSPTPTPEPPAAARVNGEIITVEAYERELARYEAAELTLGREPSAEGAPAQAKVLDALIEQLLIEQAAAAVGIVISDEDLNTELDRLIETGGGQENFAQWLEMSLYSRAEFSATLCSGMVTQAMMERVTAAVPDVAEQVHARHLVVDSVETGELALALLQEGMDFATVATEHSLDESTRVNGGDLGFFPRGLLLSPEVEEVAFSQKAGTTSELFESSFGYHIVQVLEKDSARPLAPEVQQRLRTVAFESWLEQLWASAEIERII